MKHISLALLLFSFVAFSQQENKQLEWQKNFKSTLKKAKSDKKPVVLFFTGSDWCGYCKILKADFFENEKLPNYSESFLFHYTDVPRNKDLLSEKEWKQNNELVEKYNKNKSFPKVIILSHDGKVLDEINGYSSLRDTRYHFELLDKFASR